MRPSSSTCGEQQFSRGFQVPEEMPVTGLVAQVKATLVQFSYQNMAKVTGAPPVSGACPISCGPPVRVA